MSEKNVKKLLGPAEIHLNRLPGSECYEHSYMHKEDLSCICISTVTNIILTGSQDGVIKFWRKVFNGIEFAKQYRAHISPISWISICPKGIKIASMSYTDLTVKIYDSLTMDMIDKIALKEYPICMDISQDINDPEPSLVLSSNSGLIVTQLLYGSAPKTMEIHNSKVILVNYNPAFKTCISIDDAGIIEYWDPKTGLIPNNLEFEFKVQTDLYSLAKTKDIPLTLSTSPNGELFAVYTVNRNIFIFNYLTGTILNTFSESYEAYQTIQNTNNSEFRLERIEFHRRMALEKEIDKAKEKIVISWNESSEIIIYGSYIGIKLVDVVSGDLIRLIGKSETPRFTQVSLFQGCPMFNNSGKSGAGGSSSQGNKESDPILFALGYRRNRVYLFTSRPPSQEETRDIINETLNDSDKLLILQPKLSVRLASSAVIHTTMGDIALKLFGKYCPKTVENFTRLCMNGYYCQNIFHRVIKGFMIQTGDPEGNGHGGSSIWGEDFEDEIIEDLKHDRPFTLSMANKGPNTNGSQFFITTVAASWLNGRHTLFGRVVNGMDVVCRIEGVPCDKNNKPKADVKIIDVTVNLD